MSERSNLKADETYNLANDAFCDELGETTPQNLVDSISGRQVDVLDDIGAVHKSRV